MLLIPTFKKINRRAASAAWDKFSCVLMWQLLVIGILGFAIFTVVFAKIFGNFDSIGFEIFFPPMLVFLFVLCGFCFLLLRTYAKQLKDYLSHFIVSVTFLLTGFLQIFSRTFPPGLPPPRFLT